MSIKSYEKAVWSKSSAEKYVLGKCFKNQQCFCPFCRERGFWKLGDGRRRCKRCKKVYHDLTRRWWNEVKLPLDDGLRVAKMFELELSARKIPKQLELPYKTVLRR